MKNKMQIYRNCGYLGDKPKTQEKPLLPTHNHKTEAKIISEDKMLRIQRMADKAGILLPIEYNLTIKS